MLYFLLFDNQFSIKTMWQGIFNAYKNVCEEFNAAFETINAK